jgi:hypothetical protein
VRCELGVGEHDTESACYSLRSGLFITRTATMPARIRAPSTSGRCAGTTALLRLDISQWSAPRKEHAPLVAAHVGDALVWI